MSLYTLCEGTPELVTKATFLLGVWDGLTRDKGK